MEYRVSITGLSRLALIGLVAFVVFGVAGCNEDGGPPYDPSCPFCETEDLEDHILYSCPTQYLWNGVFFYWSSCDNSWTSVANQPVFTSLADCEVARRLLEGESDYYWDPNRKYEDGESTIKLWCFHVDD